MTTGTANGTSWLRAAIWSAAALALATPLVAMQFTTEVAWTPLDFAAAAVLLGGIALCLDLTVRASGDWSFRLAAGLATAAAFGLVWVNGAVGFLGDEGNRANLIFLGVIAVAAIGALVARFRPAGLAAAMLAAAAAQVLADAVGYLAGWASPGSEGVYEVTMGTTLFTALWLASAWLFRKAA